MHDASRAATHVDDEEKELLRARVRLPPTIGPVYDHLVALPATMRSSRIHQLLVLGYMYEAQLFRGSAAVVPAMGVPTPEPTKPTVSLRTAGAARQRSTPENHATKSVTEAVSVARATARERIGSLGAMLPAD